MSVNTYEDNRILSASPVELVQILYAAAIRAVQGARSRLRAGDIAGRSREIGKAQTILAELANSVDRGQGGEFAARLVLVYDYMMSRLVEANTKQKDEPLAEVCELLGVMQEGWNQCAGQDEPALAAR